MNILEHAQLLCLAAGTSLDDVIDEALPGGVVYVGPDAVLVARREPDAWFVSLAVGKKCLHRFLLLAPEPLARIGWQRELRGQAPRYHDFQKLRLAILRHEQTQDAESSSRRSPRFNAFSGCAGHVARGDGR